MTGRKQLLVVPETQEVALGLSSYQEITTKETASTNKQYIEMVNRVGQRIAAVSGRTDYQWEFRVLASTEQNAFCLPGGKVAVYEGILPICQNEAGLAVVMSHEIGHALARHGGERMSQNYAVDGAKQLLSYATQSQEQAKREAVMKAYGAASQYGFILPYSRKHESEADHIGLILMAKAGYNPEEAPRFWTRFGQSHQGTQTPTWASTHPADATRAKDLATLLPEAMGLYVQASSRYDLGEMIAAVPAPPASAVAGGAAPAATVAKAPTTTPAASSSPTASNAPAAAESPTLTSMIPAIFGAWLPKTNAAPVQPASSSAAATNAAPATSATTPAPATSWTPPPFVPSQNAVPPQASIPAFVPTLGTPASGEPAASAPAANGATASSPPTNSLPASGGN